MHARLFLLLTLFALIITTTTSTTAQDTAVPSHPCYLPLVLAGTATTAPPAHDTAPTLRIGVAQNDDWAMCRDALVFSAGFRLRMFNVATDDQSHPRLLCARYQIGPDGLDAQQDAILRGTARYSTAGIWFTMPSTDSGGYSAMRLLPSEPLSITVKVSVGAGGLATSQTSFPIAHDECDPRYPNVCIPPPPPDWNCDALTYRNIRTEPPGPDDPHRLDADGDGIGCEWP
jgi:hypothetical protein